MGQSAIDQPGEVLRASDSPRTTQGLNSRPYQLPKSSIRTKGFQMNAFTRDAISQNFHHVLRSPVRVNIALAPPPQTHLPTGKNGLHSPGRMEGGNPSDLDAPWHSHVGWTMVLDGNYPAAEAAYRQALRQNNQFAEAHLGLGMALMMQGDLEGAISSYEEALNIQPGYPAALVHLGYTYANGSNGVQNLQKAQALFKKASDQGDPFAMLALVDLRARKFGKE